MRREDYSRFEHTVAELEAHAHEYGLDFFNMHYELCPADVVYTIAGFGMPTRFSHWSFGKHYYRQKLDFDYGMSRIYELVVNNDPCYAFFLDTNTILQNEMIIAHVLGHSDFFKNNMRFMQTNRQMVDTMSTTAHRFREYEERYGMDAVEEIIDAAMALAEHIDPSLHPAKTQQNTLTKISELDNVSKNQKPQKDLLQYILMNNEELTFWERDIIATIREEMLYFWPQIETKIMNEGWATYWHNTLMQEREVSVGDAIEFAKLTASVAAPNKFRVNPYHVGLAIWKDIESKHGKEEMFLIRECDSDVSFLRNYLNQNIVDECELYLYEKQGNEWVIAERDYKVIRDRLIAERINGGFPTLYTSKDPANRNKLILTHAFEGTELDPSYIAKTLPYVYRLWGNDVALQTDMDGRGIEYMYDGKNLANKQIS